jgi:hypothetical protein
VTLLFALKSNALAFGESLFFASAQRKVTAPRQDPLASISGAPPRAAKPGCDVLNAFAFGELLFFEGPQRKVTKRKRPFPTRRNRQSGSSTDFQTRHPWLG